MIEINDQNVEECFKYHAPTPDQIPRYQEINDAARAFALVVLKNVPRCPLRTAALNLIMDCRMKANAAIALENVT